MNDLLAHLADAADSTTSRPLGLTCPHWVATANLCRRVQDGLFVPVRQHIAFYCRGGGYPVCPHYQPSPVEAGSEAQAALESTNRRRSLRIPSQYLFRFSEIPRNGSPPTHQHAEAWTVDLSDHGLRVASSCWLPPETALRFQVEGSGSVGPRAGLGRVVWCERLGSTGFFHAGLALVERAESGGAAAASPS
jgi:hypothetical protein